MTTPEQLTKWRDIGRQKWLNDDSVKHESRQKDCYIAGYLQAKQEDAQSMQLIEKAANISSQHAHKQALEAVLALSQYRPFHDGERTISESEIKELLNEDAWVELHRLRAESKGPDGFLTWKDAAIAERLKRVAAEQALKDVAGGFFKNKASRNETSRTI